MGLYLIFGALLAALVVSSTLTLSSRTSEVPTKSNAVERLLAVRRGWYAATAVLLVAILLALFLYVAQPGQMVLFVRTSMNSFM